MLNKLGQPWCWVASSLCPSCGCDQTPPAFCRQKELGTRGLVTQSLHVCQSPRLTLPFYIYRVLGYDFTPSTVVM